MDNIYVYHNTECRHVLLTLLSILDKVSNAIFITNNIYYDRFITSSVDGEDYINNIRVCITDATIDELVEDGVFHDSSHNEIYEYCLLENIVGADLEDTVYYVRGFADDFEIIQNITYLKERKIIDLIKKGKEAVALFPLEKQVMNAVLTAEYNQEVMPVSKAASKYFGKIVAEMTGLSPVELEKGVAK